MEVTFDTHTLIWFLDRDQHSKLSSQALAALRESEATGRILVPVIALAELLHISEKRRIAVHFPDLHSLISRSENYSIVPLTEPILSAALNLTGLELHDRLILATAIHTQAPLVSRDAELRQYAANVIW